MPSGKAETMRADRPAGLIVGSAQLGLAYGAANRKGKPDGKAALSLIRRAADAGVEAFDTARAYGDSEDRLGEGLGGRRIPILTKLSFGRVADAAEIRGPVLFLASSASSFVTGTVLAADGGWTAW